ncbi:mannitol dehydrogenase family protein [Allosaccharopolyspora coralli]|uniref:Mannitol-1-phosphate 5-dehydrogenase n=1 Tax=Allosaccharopolyspora coralli TaxID=2665642 RepID=A0A5Q3QG76_9PSEU|nr:mannitol dehydrogenase family protein [Allosaccharopolyspora coralli]QGK70469.1 mannitol dehydrogenase family protein [Allosaccharopolyspora coralli]
MPRLDRTSTHRAAPAPVRAVHLGLGAFHRAHQAVYTMVDPEWGIAAYTFRSTTLPRQLTEQEGLYTVQTHGEDGPRVQVVDSISRAHPGGDHEQWLADLSSPEMALVTLTITEAAYHVSTPLDGTALGKLLAGLQERHRTGGAPLALVPCDNLPGNGGVLRAALLAAASDATPEFRTWLSEHVSFVDTVVDRITPATTDAALATVARELGVHDQVPVVTEPFSEWLLRGRFPQGRPRWEQSGARFVDDLDAYEQRKLWFLNGAHTLLAYTGPALGCTTIDEAVRHPRLEAWMESWWDTAECHAELPGDELRDYRGKLRERFASRGIRHRLLQIAADGSQKIPARILPVLRAERALGRMPASAVAALAGWVIHLRTQDVRDPDAEKLTALAHSDEAVLHLLGALSPELADDRELVTAVEERRSDLETG